MPYRSHKRAVLLMIVACLVTFVLTCLALLATPIPALTILGFVAGVLMRFKWHHRPRPHGL